MRTFFVNFIGLLAVALLAEDSLGQSCQKAKDASRIAVAGGSITEIIYFLGEQSRIIAVDRTSNFPSEAGETPSVGYVRNLSSEGLLSLKPTLVLGENDMGPEEVLTQLRATSVETRKVNEKHTSQGIVEKIRCVSSILGVPKKADEAIGRTLEPLLSELSRIRREPKESKIKVALFLMFNQGMPMVAGIDTSGDGVLKMAGLHNAFPELEGWKPVSLESMAAANPDAIVITQRGVDMAGGIEAVKAHASVRLTKAAKNNLILAVDGMSLLGFGPRTLTTAIQLSDQLLNSGD